MSKRRLRFRLASPVVLAAALFAGQVSAADAHALDRTSLPIPTPPFTGKVGKIEAESQPQFPRPVVAPEGAPNVVLVLTDDIGFATSSAFGGPVPTPNLDRLLQMGVVYNRFHTAAMCSPTRAALLTGREPHAVNYGSIGELTMGYPGYWGLLPRSAASIASVLQHNGYSTAMFGKEHNVPHSQDSPAGPFDLWPNQRGFDYFYGFLGGAMNQFNPRLFENGVAVDLSRKSDDYILDRDLADKAIGWVHTQKAAAPDRPFFLYLSPGSAHAPHQAPADWIDRFKGQFDQGWDAMRQEILARQVTKGIVPQGTVLTPRPDFIPAWDTLSAEERGVHARMMEVYAAQVAFQDDQFGRLLSELERMGVADDTLFLFIQGDNGGTAEGGLQGELNHAGQMANALEEPVAVMAGRLEEMGGPNTDQLFSVGWGWATNTPFPWTKQVASHLGGTRNPLVVAWPGHVPSGGSVRSQYAYVADIYPTILEAAGLPVPKSVDGVEQQPVDGISLLYSFTDAAAKGRRNEQAYELFGNRALYQDGWLANTTPARIPYNYGPTHGTPLDYEWELYYLPDDFSQATDLSDHYPEKLAELKSRWGELAADGKMYPISDDFSKRNFADTSTRKQVRDHFTYWGANISVPQTSGPSLGNRSFEIVADLGESDGRPIDGVIAAVGSQLGGWSFYVHEGRPVAFHARSALDADKTRIVGEPLPRGPITLRYVFTYEGPGRNGAGTMRIYVGDRIFGEGRIAQTISSPVPFPETFDTGRDAGAHVSPDYLDSDKFSGELRKLTITLAPKP